MGAARIHSVVVRSGRLIDAVQLIYETPEGIRTGPRHGGAGGAERSFRLGDGEFIARVEGRYGGAVDSIAIGTNRRPPERFGGRGGDQEYVYEAPLGTEIIGFWGTHGQHGDDADVVTAIGVFLRPRG